MTHGTSSAPLRANAAAVFLALAVAAAGLLACGDDGGQPDVDAGIPAAFPADYAASYVEVRNCRKSGDHDLNYIRVLADPDALGPFMDRVTPFPDGAVVLKEEYDFADDTCSGDIVRWTVMVKNSAAADRLGWDWQNVTAERSVAEENTPRCFGCHQACTGAPEVGYDFTCAEP